LVGGIGHDGTMAGVDFISSMFILFFCWHRVVGDLFLGLPAHSPKSGPLRWCVKFWKRWVSVIRRSRGALQLAGGGQP
jgi:hypothetical protein